MNLHQKQICIFLFLFTFILTCPTILNAVAKKVTKTKTFTYTRLFYYQDGQNAKKSFFAHTSSVDIFAPQTYSLDSNGVLSGSVDQDLLDFSLKHKIKVMPLVTNGKFSPSVSQSILDNTAVQDSAINAMVTEAIKNKYYGWQIDFEQVDASYKDKFSAFVQKVNTVFKQNNLALSVAVVAKTSDRPSDYHGTLWQKLIGVYDYDALASNTDFVSVMSYDDPESMGPVARYSWLEEVLKYSLDHIPKEKISLGLAFYYWQWSNESGKRVGIGGNEGIQNILNKHKVSLHYSTIQQAPYITYTSHSKSFTLWYENAKSIAKKIELIKKNELFGFSGWALGLELANVHSALTSNK